MNRTAVQWLAGASVAAAVLAGSAHEARAQQSGNSVSVTGKGIVGGALLGGEVVMITMGAIGVERAWPYLAFGGLGAVAGGVGGYFVEHASPPAEVPLYMLAGGMALVIPTMVVTLNATHYKPPESDQTEPVRNEPAADPAQPGGTVQITTDATPAGKKADKPIAAAAPGPRPRARARGRSAAAPAPDYHLGLVDITPERIAFGVPAVELRPLYAQEELFKFRVTQGQELRFPILRATF